MAYLRPGIPDMALGRFQDFLWGLISPLRKRRGSFPADSVARFHLGNGASLYRVNAGADRSDKGWRQSRGVMVNYLCDRKRIEANHEQYSNDGRVLFHDRLKPL